MERLAAYTELLAVEGSLQEGFGVSLAQTAPWPGSVLRPLRAGEERVKVGTGYSIRTAETEELIPEVPTDHSMWPSMVHWVDQGSVGAAALNFCIDALGYHMLALPDPNHRVWNDIKMAAQKSKVYFWKTIVQLTLVFNLNYGPFRQQPLVHGEAEFFQGLGGTHHRARQPFSAMCARDCRGPWLARPEHRRRLSAHPHSCPGHEQFCQQGPTGQNHALVQLL